MQLLFLLLFSVFLLIFFNSRKYPSFHHPVDLMGSSL
jgi:hypothetical protein